MRLVTARTGLGAGLMTALTIASLLLIAIPTHAEKTDIVILQNGDRITGEIKKLEAGLLKYSTDDMDNVYIEWEKIHHIKSTHRFEIIDIHGVRRYSSMDSTATPGEVVVRTPVADDVLEIIEIVRITPIEAGFLQRLDGSISVGFSYTRATDTAEFTLGGDTSYRGEKNAGKLEYSGYISDQSEQRTSRYNASLSYERFLRRRWTVGSALTAEGNEELGLDSRYSLTLNGSRYIVETNKTILKASLGLAGTREIHSDTDSTSYNLELPVTADYKRFTFQNPESNIQLSGSIYPNLTTSVRYRASVNLDLNHELLSDLFFVIQVYYDFDNQPPEGAAKDDYRFSTSISWSFG